jgi:hypothetical protein
VTEAEAMTAIHEELRSRLQHGTKIQSLDLKVEEELPEIWERMRSNPVHSDMEKAIADYGKISNAVPDAD